MAHWQTDHPTDKPTDRQTIGFIEKFHFQKYIEPSVRPYFTNSNSYYIQKAIFPLIKKSDIHYEHIFDKCTQQANC